MTTLLDLSKDCRGLEDVLTGIEMKPVDDDTDRDNLMHAVAKITRPAKNNKYCGLLYPHSEGDLESLFVIRNFKYPKNYPHLIEMKIFSQSELFSQSEPLDLYMRYKPRDTFCEIDKMISKMKHLDLSYDGTRPFKDGVYHHLLHSMLTALKKRDDFYFGLIERLDHIIDNVEIKNSFDYREFPRYLSKISKEDVDTRELDPNLLRNRIKSFFSKQTQYHSTYHSELIPHLKYFSLSTQIKVLDEAEHTAKRMKISLTNELLELGAVCREKSQLLSLISNTTIKKVNKI